MNSLSNGAGRHTHACVRACVGTCELRTVRAFIYLAAASGDEVRFKTKSWYVQCVPLRICEMPGYIYIALLFCKEMLTNDSILFFSPDPFTTRLRSTSTLKAHHMAFCTCFTTVTFYSCCVLQLVESSQ